MKKALRSPNVAHHDVDKGVLDEGEENKESARRHEHINCLPENRLHHTTNCHKNMTRLNMKGTLNFCFLAYMK